MNNEVWKVGELSKLTGITVRTLHHYDEIRLLSPRDHTNSGHRLYSKPDIIKLQQIMSLKQLGFSLDQIGKMFEDPGYNPQEILNTQLQRLKEEIKVKEDLKDQLQALKEVFDGWHQPTADQFIKVIEMMQINQSKYFTEEQRKKLKQQYSKLNAIETKDFADNWSELVAALQGEMERGTPPDAPTVAELAKRWQKGIDFFTDGDEEIAKSAELYYRNNPEAAKGSGISGELYAYIRKALTNS